MAHNPDRAAKIAALNGHFRCTFFRRPSSSNL